MSLGAAFALHSGQAGQALDDELFETAWESLVGLREFYDRVAERGAAVVFTVV